MARPRAIDDSTLLKLLDEYIDKNVVSIDKFKFAKFGEFIRGKGHEVQDSVLRRNLSLKARLEELQEAATPQAKTIIYSPIDIAEAVEHCKTKDDLIELMERRERYYRDKTILAGKIFKENAELTELNVSLSSENSYLKAKHSDSEDILQELKKEIRDLKKQIEKYRTLISTYVYPEAANELLKAEGLYQGDNVFLDPVAFDSMVIDGDTDIQKFNNSSVSNLLHLFGE